MLELLQLEWKKVVLNRTFRITIALYVILLPLLFMTVQSIMNVGGNDPVRAMLVANTYKFPQLWETMAYWASYMSFFLLVYLSIWTITTEYSYKTLRQNLITGVSRRRYLLAKFVFLGTILLCSTLYLGLVTLFFGWWADGSSEILGKEMWSLLYFALQNTFYMSFAFMLGLLFKRSGLATIIFYAYVMVVERIIRYLVMGELLGELSLGSYFPASTAWDTLPMYMVKRIPGFGDDDFLDILLTQEQAGALTFVYTLICWIISYRVFMKRDL